MLNHVALNLLASPDRINSAMSQRALRLFSDFDLSLPRLLIAEQLDSRYSWPSGTSARLLKLLAELHILKQLGRQANSSIWLITAEMGWTPRSLAAHWQMMQRSQDRMQLG